MRISFASFFVCCCLPFAMSQAQHNSDNAPTGLTVNFLSHADRIFLNGYPTNSLVTESDGRTENFQYAEISQKRPFFGWVVNSNKKNIVQTAYQILVSSTLEKIRKDEGDMWNSGKVESDESINIKYAGKPLEEGKVYFWKVKTWDNHQGDPTFSKISQFRMASSLEEYATAVYPIQKSDVFPERIEQIAVSHHFVDFGKAGFGRIRARLYSEGSDTVVIHLGEVADIGRIDREPGGSRRYSSYQIPLLRGWNTYVVALKPDKRNTGPQAILMPGYIGEVTPFRYAEIENYKYRIAPQDIVRETAFYPFDEEDSYFNCSDSVLNQVWELCKYSIKATSFTGIYVDGDRERIPYEADALINQLSHYGVAREYSMARASHEYLINHPTWPTEWIMQSVLIAWEDYMYTGNRESIEFFYEDLKAKSLIALSNDQAFISTRTGKVSPEVLKSIHFGGQLRDIVDWPHTGILGLEKNEGGETDGFVFTDVNTVVNAYHYRALTIMEQIARLLNKTDDAAMFARQSARLKKSFNEKLFDKKQGAYVDGLGTDHASLHANMFPLAFGLVPPKYTGRVAEFIRLRGMACSVYGSQFLLDAVYNAYDADYGLQLLSSTAERSWYNMIRAGSTISLEAWDNKYKPNQDWNHAWGAAPANLIPRKLMGIEPLEPGFRKIQIKPQPSHLESAEIRCPTIRGEVRVSFINRPGQSFRLNVSLPGNTTAKIYLPFLGKGQKVLMDNKPIDFVREGDFVVIDNVGSGDWSFETGK